MSGHFKYYRVEFKLATEMLGTIPGASIYHKHVITKAKKEIAKVNKLSGKIAKSLAKYQDVNFSEHKEIEEIKGCIRGFSQLTGKPVDIPSDITIEDLLLLAEEAEEEYKLIAGKSEEQLPTRFLRDEDGWPMISTHMVLGNLKENLKICVNNGDKSILTSKVSVGEVGALDVKAIEMFMRPSNDISPEICERPIKSDNMGKVMVAIARSEMLPVGTEFGCTLRIRSTSVFAVEENLKKCLDMGKNNGLGAWRGSGNKGAYWFKLTPLPDYVETTPEGWC